MTDSFVRNLQIFLKYAKEEQEEYGVLLETLWATHGRLLITAIWDEDGDDFRFALDFYHFVFKKLTFDHSVLCEELSAVRAGDGHVEDICKFVVLILESMRRRKPDTLKEIFDRMSVLHADVVDGFFVQMFNNMDALMESDTSEDWWLMMAPASRKSSETSVEMTSKQMVNTPSTPTRNGATASLSTSTFRTPATDRRLRAADRRLGHAGSRRSPLIDAAVDSPRMKVYRAEEECRQLRLKINALETQVGEQNREKETMTQCIRDLRSRNEDVRGKLSLELVAKVALESDVQGLGMQLAVKNREFSNLLKEYDDLRHNNLVLRTELDAADSKMQMEMQNLDKEKVDLQKKLADERDDKEVLRNQLGEMRAAERDIASQLNEAKFEIGQWRDDYNALRQQLASLTETNEMAQRREYNLQDELHVARQTIDHLTEDLARKTEAAERSLASKDEVQASLERRLHEAIGQRDELRSAINELSGKISKTEQDLIKKEVLGGDARASLEAASSRVQLLVVQLTAREKLCASLEQQLVEEKKLYDDNAKKREQQWVEAEKHLLANVEMMRQRCAEAEARVDEQRKLRAEQEETWTQAKQLLLQKIEMEKEVGATAKAHFDGEIASEKHKNAQFVVECQKSIAQLKEEINEERFQRSVLDAEKQILHQELNKLQEDVQVMKIGKKLMEGEDVLRCSSPESMTSEERAHIKQLLGDKRPVPSDQCFSFWHPMDDDEPVQAPPPPPPPAAVVVSTPSLKAVKFKEPFTPAPVDRERLAELQRRNERVGPALRCAYGPEMFDVASPTGNEENMRQPNKEKMSKMRRVSGIFKRK